MKMDKYSRKRLTSRDAESGMTMLELIVALTISGILALIAFQFFSSATTGFGESRQAAEMQQELRWGMSFLSDHVKLAGNGIPATCGWPKIEAVNGADGEPDSLTVMGCFKSVNINTTQPWGNAGAQEKLDDTSEIEIGDLAVISDGTYSEVFLMTDKTDLHVWHDTYPPWNDDKKLDHRYAAGSTLTIVSYYQFYVETDEDGRNNLVLKHQVLDSQILIGDVEDFQVRFKMKSGQWLDEPASDEIQDIEHVEVKIISRSPDPIPKYTDPDYGDGYKRIEVKSKVTPKNLALF